MSEKTKRCMICGKSMDTDQSICKPCNESIQGEAVGKRKKLAKSAEKEIKRQGQKISK